MSLIKAVEPGNLGRTDHVERVEHQLLEPRPGHRLIVDEEQLRKVDLGDGSHGLDAVELAGVGRRLQALEVVSELLLRYSAGVGRCSIVEQYWLLDVVLELASDLVEEAAEVDRVGAAAQVPDRLPQVWRDGSEHCLAHPLVAEGCQIRFISSLPGLLLGDP